MTPTLKPSGKWELSIWLNEVTSITVRATTADECVLRMAEALKR